jgi:thioredoxin-related protein
MRRLALQLAALAVAVLPPVLPSPAAARSGVGPMTATSSYELVVFEADGCHYCEDFRRDVLPLYRASQIGRDTPLRFVNVSRSDETKMGLSGAIVMAPTVVLMHQGQEVDRIVGYTGPGNFMKLVAFMMGRGD